MLYFYTYIVQYRVNNNFTIIWIAIILIPVVGKMEIITEGQVEVILDNSIIIEVGTIVWYRHLTWYTTQLLKITTQKKVHQLYLKLLILTVKKLENSRLPQKMRMSNTEIRPSFDNLSSSSHDLSLINPIRYHYCLLTVRLTLFTLKLTKSAQLY